MPGSLLRRRLVLLAAAGVLPLAIVAGIGLYVLGAPRRSCASTACASWSSTTTEAVSPSHAILTRAGADVRSCLEAGPALEVLRALRPDVLASDIEMPGEDGDSLMQKVRTLPPGEGGRTPAVAHTAYGRAQDRMRSLAAGYNMHVPKPVDPGELTAIVASVAARLAPP